LFDVLFKMFDEELKNWINNFHVMFWTDRFIVKFIIDLISFYLQCDNESILLIELKILSEEFFLDKRFTLSKIYW
jgi:hypothetical protein